MKVLVKEKIADTGVELLSERFDVELGIDWDDGELAKRIGEFDGILIRSAVSFASQVSAVSWTSASSRAVQSSARLVRRTSTVANRASDSRSSRPRARHSARQCASRYAETTM